MGELSVYVCVGRLKGVLGVTWGKLRWQALVSALLYLQSQALFAQGLEALVYPINPYLEEPRSSQVFDSSGDFVHQASGLSFPVSLGGLSRTGVSDFETQSAGMGFGMHYRGSGLSEGVEAIIYVYNLRVKEVPAGLQSPMLAQIRQMTRREIAHQAELESFLARPVFGNILRMDGARGTMEALFDGFVLNARDQSPRGYHFAALWTAKNHFIKLKVKRGADSIATPDVMGAFVQAVLAQTHLTH